MSGIGAKSQTGEEHVWRPNPLTRRLKLPSIHLSQSRPRTRSHNKRDASSFARGSALSRCQTDRQKWCMDRCISWQYGHKLTHTIANLKTHTWHLFWCLEDGGSITSAHPLLCPHTSDDFLQVVSHYNLLSGPSLAKLSVLFRIYCFCVPNPPSQYCPILPWWLPPAK